MRIVQRFQAVAAIAVPFCSIGLVPSQVLGELYHQPLTRLQGPTSLVLYLGCPAMCIMRQTGIGR